MKNYYQIRLGRKNIFSEEGQKGNFIGVDFLGNMDLSKDCLLDSKEFNRKFIPIWLSKHQDKTKTAGAISCGFLWTAISGIKINDIVLCPDGKGNFHVGEINSDYKYNQGKNLPHQRDVIWYSTTISKQSMSKSLSNSLGAIGTVAKITKHAREIENLLSGNNPRIITTTDETIENASEFALEEQLEEFLIENWKSIEISKNYDILEEDGDLVGQQYPTDVGEIDILAISKDKNTLLVIELKRGRTSDVVVGQCLRYMGYVKNELAEENQKVRGMIIGHDEDLKIKHALSMTPDIDFYTYRIDFQLKKISIK